MATRAAGDMGTSFEKGKLLTYGRKSYPASAVLAAIKELESAEGGGEGTGARRKSKHCILRLCERAALNGGMWFGHRTQLSKVELDNKVTGKTRPALVKIWEQFKDDQVRVPSTFADDERVLAAGIEPNIVHQPDITFDKFIAMKNEIIKDHGDMHVSFKKSGSHDEMFSFCMGGLDTYYYGLMCAKYPEIEHATTQMLPAGTEHETTGVGGAEDGGDGAEGATADASRRVGAKKDAKERNAALRAQHKKHKKQDKEIQNAAKVAATAAREELGLGAGLGSLLAVSSGPKYADAPTSFYDTIEGCETRAKKFDYSAKLCTSLHDLKARIRQEKALGSEADPEDLELMEAELKKVRAALR